MSVMRGARQLDVSRMLHVFALLLVPLLYWTLSGDRYGFPAALGWPLLMIYSDALLAFLVAILLIAFVALQFVGISWLGDGFAVICLISGVYAHFQDRLYRRVNAVHWLTGPTFQRPARTLAMIFSAVLVLSTLLRGVPWIPCAVLALAYAALLARGGPLHAKEVALSYRRAAANAALILVSTVLSLAALEIGARTFIHMPAPSLPSRDSFEANDATIWAPRPFYEREYSVQIGPNKTRTFTVTHASNGLRGPEIGPKLPGEFRIALIGDSFTYGWGVNKEEDIAGQLERLANIPGGRKVTVINLGVPGYSPWQEIELFKQRGLPLQPDLVVMQLFPNNDIPDTLLKLDEALPVFGDAEIWLARNWKYYTQWRVRWERNARAVSAAYNAYRTLFPEYWGLVELADQFRFVSPRRDAFAFQKKSMRSYWIEVLLKQWYPQLDKAWTEFQADVLAMVQLCGREQIPIFFYALPLQLFSDSDFDITFDNSRDASGEDVEYEPHKDTRIVEEFFAANDLNWIPVLRELQALDRPYSLFIPEDGHFNENGSQFMATLIFNRLVREGHLKGPEAAWIPPTKKSGAAPGAPPRPTSP